MRRVWKNFIVIEGLDGAGTTTQRDALVQRLEAEKKPVMGTCEPTDMPSGQIIRQILRREWQAEPETLARLFAADRFEHLYGKKGIQKALADNRLVISDRYTFSSLAYQSVQVPYAEVALLNQNFPLPEITFYIQVSLEECRKRREKRGASQKELFDYDGYLQKAADNYEKSFTELSGSTAEFRRIDGSRSAEAIHAELWAILKEKNLC